MLRNALRRIDAWMIALALGALAVPAAMLLSAGETIDATTRQAAFSLVILVAAIEAWRLPRNRWPFLGLVGGLLLVHVGDILATTGRESVSTIAATHVPDQIALGGYVLIAAGLMTMVRAQSPLRDVGAVVDGLMVAVGAAALFWAIVVYPDLAAPGLTTLDRIMVIAIPAGDLLVFALAMQLAFSHARRLVPFWAVMSGLAILLAAKVVDADAARRGDEAGIDLLTIGWWATAVLILVAILHPHAPVLADRYATRSPSRLTIVRLTLLSGVPLAIYTVLATRVADQSWASVPVLLGSTVVVFYLLVVRLVLVNRQLERNREQLEHDATHDPLTGLANRTLFAELLAKALVRRREPGRNAAVLCIDLDDFKAVNDSLGHAVGDELLCEIAARVQIVTRPSDVVARLGGDEFAVVIDDAEPDNALDVAERIIHEIRRPLDVGAGVILHVGASIGIAVGGASTSVDAILRDADIAMYLAKAEGKGRPQVFRPGMQEQVVDRLALRSELVDALTRDQLTLHYQPIHDVRTNTLKGAEALLRWNHPTRGEIAPTRFISIAEETGLIVDIGAWVLNEACRRAQTWTRNGTGLDIAVNVSAVQLFEPGLVEAVRRALETTGLDPRRLVIELTETAMVHDLPEAAQRLHALRDLGVRIALDDFGSGFTSVQHLGAFPLDVVKLDRAFVVSELANGAEVLTALVGLANNLGFDVVAEGVETVEQLTALREMGCRYVQGYLVSRPLTALGFATKYLAVRDDQRHGNVVGLDRERGDELHVEADPDGLHVGAQP